LHVHGAQEVAVAKATSISLEKLTTTVQSAVKAAIEKHPRFKVDPNTPLTQSYLIWGIPVPDAIAGGMTVRDAQAFATEVASKLGPAFSGAAVEGTFLSHRGHLIIGIPVPPEVLFER
jgi:hypothetical protein